MDGRRHLGLRFGQFGLGLGQLGLGLGQPREHLRPSLLKRSDTRFKLATSGTVDHLGWCVYEATNALRKDEIDQHHFVHVNDYRHRYDARCATSR